jgi:hypothetical protein
MNRKKKINQRIKQGLLLIFLAMIVLGFTVPGFIGSNQGDSSFEPAEARLCQSDSDCYLDCNDNPLAILCSQNLCLQNSCEEGSLYALHSANKEFNFEIVVNGEKLELLSRINIQDFFITFNDNGNVDLSSSGLALRHVLDKVKVQYDGNCISFDNVQYCSNVDAELNLIVNGEKSLAGPHFIPSDGDIVKIVYS